MQRIMQQCSLTETIVSSMKDHAFEIDTRVWRPGRLTQAEGPRKLGVNNNPQGDLLEGRD